ncbi:MAG: membrane protein [Hyphobacterium sp.]|nr:MAG: membrane protein [Hyphobacterium sp.]
MMLELTLRWLHVGGATVLLGTGAGIAFFMLMAHRTNDAALIAHTAGVVVIADMVFTATAVILQPITGIWLAYALGWPLSDGWIVLSLGLYVLTGAFWLPVVWIQMRMRDIARCVHAADSPLPPSYHKLFRIWFACGIPAFLAVLTILWLMIARPSFSLPGV